MKYYTHHEKETLIGFIKSKIKKEKKDVVKLNALDKVILRKCEIGADILSIIYVSKPYVNQYGTKTFATTPEVRHRVLRLVDKGLLERR